MCELNVARSRIAVWKLGIRSYIKVTATFYYFHLVLVKWLFQSDRCLFVVSKIDSIIIFYLWKSKLYFSCSIFLRWWCRHVARSPANHVCLFLVQLIMCFLWLDVLFQSFQLPFKLNSKSTSFLNFTFKLPYFLRSLLFIKQIKLLKLGAPLVLQKSFLFFKVGV